MPKPKRKTTEKESSNPAKVSRKETESSSNPHVVDLRGFAETPDALKSHLKNNLSSPPEGKSWSIQTDQFPRGCMKVLLDHLAEKDGNIAVVQFQNHYGKVYKNQLQNPDLKLLVKTHGKSLTHLQMTPLDKESPAPKLQGCGYRWITQHAPKLQVLELSVKYDVKQELLDFSRKTPLQVDTLRQVTLRDVGTNTTWEQVMELVTRAKHLERLVLVDVDPDVETKGDLGCALVMTAMRLGNKKFSVGMEHTN